MVADEILHFSNNRRCRDEAPGEAAHDSLGIELLPQPAPDAPDLYVLRFDWRFVVPLVSPRTQQWAACRESMQRLDGIGFEFRASLPPGERIRADAQAGFEIFLTRDADAPSGVPVRGTPRLPVRLDVDFDIVVEGAGAIVWRGALHQETVADKASVAVQTNRPRPIDCLEGNRSRRCLGQDSDRWELSVQARNGSNDVDIGFGARRSAPAYDLHMVSGSATYPLQRGSDTASEARRRVEMAPGGTASVHAGDFIVRVSRR